MLTPSGVNHLLYLVHSFYFILCILEILQIIENKIQRTLQFLYVNCSIIAS